MNEEEPMEDAKEQREIGRVDAMEYKDMASQANASIKVIDINIDDLYIASSLT